MRKYVRIVRRTVVAVGLGSSAYGTHSIRCTEPTLIYRRTKNLRAVPLVLDHTKIESAIRHFGISSSLKFDL
jgi:hypothetical protein